MACCSSSSFQQESAEERSVVSMLTDDTLLIILRCLSTRELLISGALVCRRWHRLCKQYLVYELVPNPYNPSDSPWGKMNEGQLFQLAVSHSLSLERLSFHGFWRTSNYIISFFPHLRELKDLSIDCGSVTELEAIAKELPTQLVSLDLHANHFVASRCQDCSFTYPPAIQDSVLSAIHQRCPQLQKLNLDSCSNITMQGLEKLLQANQALTSLDLHSHELGWPEVAKIFDTCRSLQHFSLVSPLLLEQSFSIFEVAQEEGYSLRRNFRKKGYKTAARALRIQLPRYLTSLRLYSSPHRSIPMELAAPMLGLLKESGMQLLSLHAQGVYNTTWQTIQTWCPNLKLLDLSHSKHESISLAGVERLVLCGLIRMLKKLEYIALPAATDAILRQLGDHCPKLRELRFEGSGKSGSSYFSDVTDTGVIAVVEGCSDLRVLSLAGCRKITIRAARAIAFHCRQLKVLILSHCRGIKDDAVSTMLPRLSSSLLILDLIGCKISLVSLQAILQYANVTTLRVVAVKLPTKKTEELVNQTSHPRLQIKVCTSYIHWDGFYNAALLN